MSDTEHGAQANVQTILAEQDERWIAVAIEMNALRLIVNGLLRRHQGLNGDLDIDLLQLVEKVDLLARQVQANGARVMQLRGSAPAAEERPSAEKVH